MAFVEVHRSEFSVISVDPKGPLVRMVRTDAPFSSLDILEKHVSELIRTLDGIGREGRVLLNDLRAVKGRNDSTFEERMTKLRPRLYSGFVRVGILVRTSAGALQVRRIMNGDGVDRVVMTDEAALLQFLLQG